jgi:hypothetical protein
MKRGTQQSKIGNCRAEIKRKEYVMRRTLLVVAAAVALAVPAVTASAQPVRYHYTPNYVAPAAGVAVGTGVGLAVSEGVIGGSLGAALPATAAGAAAVGGVAGIGAAALVHAATTPCQGFHMLFGNLFTSSDGCVNGQWVGHQPAVVERTVVRRRVR